MKKTTINKNKPIINHFHHEKGYAEAKKWLKEIGEWDYVNTHGFSTDGWSIIATANSMWNKRKKL